MILHRLRLTNFRGVADREIHFPDHGVVVVCGPNEVGKSSMLEALDLLLNFKDRSTHRDVKAVKPTHADAGAQVEAEISTGPYRFVYRKRFHKKQMTELDIVEPKRQQLTGDEAHERVEAILGETVDARLWDAQRLLQASSTEAVNLSGCDALSRALDAAAGDVTGPAGDDSLLIDSIDLEYLRYFTSTGRPTKDWKAAIDRVAAAQAEVDRCAAAVAEVEDRVLRHEELAAAVRSLAAELASAGARRDAAQHACVAVRALAAQVEKARTEAGNARDRAARAALENTQRQQLIADAERRGRTLVELQDQLAEAEREEAAAQAAANTATKDARAAAGAREAAQQRCDDARAAQQRGVALEEASRLAARLQRIEETTATRDALASRLAAMTITDDVLADIEQASALVGRLEAQLNTEAGIIEFTAAADLEITVDGAPRTLTAGQLWEQPSQAAVLIDLPGVLNVRIVPGATAAKLHSDLQAAQQVLRELLCQGGVEDLPSARVSAQQRRVLETDRANSEAALAVLIDGEGVAQLRATLAGLQAGVTETGGAPLDVQAAGAELFAATGALDSARTVAAAAQQIADAASAHLAAKNSRVAVLRDKHQTASEELASVGEQLTLQRGLVADADLVAADLAGAQVLSAAEAAVAELVEQYDAAAPVDVERELAGATAEFDAIAADHESARSARNTLTVQLGVIGSEGRQGKLAEAEAALEHALQGHRRVQERADAAKLLRDTMIRHRDNARQRYVEPYRSELERLGREVFDASFEVDVNTELTIESRTLGGCTVPYDSLSGGAKEQLGVLARLAGAALVAKEDTVPVVIDDALGFTDPERLVLMGKVLGTVGDRGQVIVLTCTPGRYDSVADAEVIEISA